MCERPGKGSLPEASGADSGPATQCLANCLAFT